MNTVALGCCKENIVLCIKRRHCWVCIVQVFMVTQMLCHGDKCWVSYHMFHSRVSPQYKWIGKIRWLYLKKIDKEVRLQLTHWDLAHNCFACFALVWSNIHHCQCVFISYLPLNPCTTPLNPCTTPLNPCTSPLNPCTSPLNPTSSLNPCLPSKPLPPL